jgi:DNA-binding CsgD family transcriptional regulator
VASKASVQLMVFVPQESNAVDIEKMQKTLGPSYRVIELDHRGASRTARAVQAVGDAFSLTPRQRQILTEVVAGLTNHAIARKFGIAKSTVKTHIEAIFQRTESGGRHDLCALVYRWLPEA